MNSCLSQPFLSGNDEGLKAAITIKGKEVKYLNRKITIRKRKKGDVIKYDTSGKVPQCPVIAESSKVQLKDYNI